MLAKDNNDECFEAHRHPMCVLNLFATPSLRVNDPEVVQQLYTTHSNLIDKNGLIRDIMDPLLGYSFLFAKNGQDWQKKRKAVAHAFYKEKLIHQTQTLKDILASKFQ